MPSAFSLPTQRILLGSKVAERPFKITLLTNTSALEKNTHDQAVSRSLGLRRVADARHAQSVIPCRWALHGLMVALEWRALMHDVPYLLVLKRLLIGISPLSDAEQNTLARL